MFQQFQGTTQDSHYLQQFLFHPSTNRLYLEYHLRLDQAMGNPYFRLDPQYLNKHLLNLKYRLHLYLDNRSFLQFLLFLDKHHLDQQYRLRQYLHIHLIQEHQLFQGNGRLYQLWYHHPYLDSLHILINLEHLDIYLFYQELRHHLHQWIQNHN